MSSSQSSNSLISSETIIKNSKLGQFLMKFSYISLIFLEIVVYFYGNVPVSFQVLLAAVSCIIAGSFGSLRHPQSIEAQEVEKMKPKDAYLFPIIGSCVLFSLYFALKHLPSFIFEYGISIFFAIISVFAVQGMNEEIVKLFIPSSVFNVLNIELLTININYKLLFIFPFINKSIHLPIISISNQRMPANEDSNDSILVTVLNVISLMLGVLVAGIWLFYDQHWLANNIIGISISIQAISFLNPGSFYTAFVLLSLLFFYDIFWVFFTDVMVSVAKNLKAPIKLVFPRPSVSDRSNMLGLGDIVLPGIYIALLLRYDVKQCFVDISNIVNCDKYAVGIRDVLTFVFVIVCYCISLCVCLIIMFYFEHAQPALLYIVPGIIIPVVLLAFIRGDFWKLWAFEEEDEKDEKDKKE